jgi:hypothetical protein
MKRTNGFLTHQKIDLLRSNTNRAVRGVYGLNLSAANREDGRGELSKMQNQNLITV